MWKCPDCETVNQGEKCYVCGKDMPADAVQFSNNSQMSSNYGIKQTQGNVKTKKGSKLIISIVIILLVVLVALVGASVYLHGEKTKFDSAMKDAEKYYEMKDFKACANTLEDVEDNFYFKKSGEGFLIRGMAYLEMDDYNNAILYLEKAQELKESTEGAMNLAVCYAKTGQEKKALNSLYTKNISEREDIAYYVKAEIFTHKEMYDNAVDNFYNSIKASDDDVLKKKAYIAIARIYKDRRHEDKDEYIYIDKQIEVMEEAVRVLKAEDDLTLTEMMAEAYFTGWEHDLAIMKFQRLLELGYDRPYIHRNIAIIYQEMDDYEKAEETLFKMKEIYPEEYQCYLQLALLYIEMENEKTEPPRDYTKAVDNYKLAKKYVDSQSETELVQLEKELEEKGWI